ncbi:efflux transporter outer membrane subunit [Pseudomonas syringae]|uniref:efflux transporter outer membrane subunit n=1 Tax=Pseudomonas syringae TaxID=317 RepID=UPI003F74D7CE
MNARIHLLTATIVLLTGCSLAPTYDRPAPPIPEQWTMTPVTSAQPSSAATLDWRSFVTDEPLRQLITQALSNNRDLRQTLLNVEAARAQYQVQRADRLPNIDAQSGGTRQRTPADVTPSGRSQIGSTWQAGVGLAAFEVDLFGRVRNLSVAALEEYLATEEGARAARISLISEVISAYLTRSGAQSRYALTQQTLDARESSLDLISQRRNIGVATALDYQEALGLTEQARADLERIDRQFRQTNNALSLLVGVSNINKQLADKAGPDLSLVQAISPGAPSELLIHRPDIQAAEHRLLARNANIGAARAAFFPRITLTGMYGSSSSQLSNLFESGQQAWSFAPQITLPIFAGGGNRANLDLAKVRKDIAIVDYEKSIQTAFREVSDALAATDTLQREEKAQRGLAQSSTLAMQLSEARYRSGVDGHLRYLDAQRHAFANQILQIEVSTQRQIALATLFRTLGGGWTGDVLAQQAR